MITLIAAMSANRIIGKDGSIPWRMPSDLRRFKKLTIGKTVIMGRKTFESLPQIQGTVLPGRHSIIVSRSREYANYAHAQSFERALEFIRPQEEAFVIGGGEIYALALPYAHRIHLSTILIETEGDAFFPEIPSEWSMLYSELMTKEPQDDFEHTYSIYQR